MSSGHNANTNGTCPCGKVGFDKRTAQTKRNDLANRGNARNLKIYQCDESDLWHLSKGHYRGFQWEDGRRYRQ